MSGHFINLLLKASKDTPLVSGIMKITNKSCKTIMMAKKKNTFEGPITENDMGTREGIMAASTQCTELPND